jgi:DNA-binding MarR family transcriptional regulator
VEGDGFERRSARLFEALREIRTMSHRPLYEELYGSGEQMLEPAQFDALEMLLAKTEWRMADFATALRVDRSTATRMVDRLVRAGVAVRAPSEDDLRGIVVRATREGRLRRTRVVEGRREFMREFLRSFSDEEIDTLTALLERLADSVADVADERARAVRAAASEPAPGSHGPGTPPTGGGAP